MEPIAILGTGLAGYTLARELRKQGYAGPLTLISADDGAFYSKPMISNALAQGRSAEALIQQRPEAMAAQLQAQILSETQVLAVDPAARTLTLADGQVLRYAQLVLALGAEPLRLPLPGDAADQVLSVNNRQDYEVFRAALQRPGPVVVKTPALPLVVTPPPPGQAGQWLVEGQGRDRLAWFVDPEGKRRGVLATGSQASRRDLVGQLGA